MRPGEARGKSLEGEGREAMKLSVGEKLILMMLAAVSKHLNVKSEIDPNFVMEAISSGHSWALSWQYPMLSGEEPSNDTVKEVGKILTMWRVLEQSYARLSLEEQAKIGVGADPFGKQSQFPGFDGNYETEYLGVAWFMIKELRLFDEFKERELNSHRPVLDEYRRMLAVYEPSLRKALEGGLDVDSITAILRARAR